ncbi:hypothetical protein [Tepidibacter hydrothermalis]|uniref:Uncharacterized protein n=1 Tax=Tepidibacter hydrothermalis TaxID=3036126 RepID=A0ABY8EB01_9FIRM|nr:hypothetical protein [Tepidibacter hydrothermalis]WFD08779.1 hypothetical protein P4S50_10250 [Tepidibacter hydrothermalis]
MLKMHGTDERIEKYAGMECGIGITYNEVLCELMKKNKDKYYKHMPQGMDCIYGEMIEELEEVGITWIDGIRPVLDRLIRNSVKLSHMDEKLYAINCKTVEICDVCFCIYDDIVEFTRLAIETLKRERDEDNKQSIQDNNRKSLMKYKLSPSYTERTHKATLTEEDRVYREIERNLYLDEDRLEPGDCIVNDFIHRDD